MNFKLSKLGSSGAGITNCGVGESWGWVAGSGRPMLSSGGRCVHHLGFWEAATTDSICSVFLSPKQTNQGLDQSPTHQTPLGCRLPLQRQFLNVKEIGKRYPSVRVGGEAWGLLVRKKTRAFPCAGRDLLLPGPKLQVR